MKYIITLFIVTILCGCGANRTKKLYPTLAHVASEMIVIDGHPVPVHFGGYGSSMVYHPADSCFYLLTDRGPNVDGSTPESKVFAVPAYSPTIGRFRLNGDSLLLVEKIVLREADGTPFTGLPNTEGDGKTGEVAYDINGRVLVSEGRGLDTEGLAIAPDGTFWVSDEYASFVMQFDRQGKLLKELSPFNGGLPAHYARRRPNRGMEGLTINRSGDRLFGIMQSPLYYPDASTKNHSVNNRIIGINVLNGDVFEYIYQMEHSQNVVSEICFVNDSILYVLERDGEFPKNGKGFKRIYSVNIAAATNIGSRIVELFTEEELQQESISPVKKTLLCDIMEVLPAYPHDKPEGITLVGDSILCVVNDDDFGINVPEKADGSYVSKTSANGMPDRNVVYFIRINQKKDL